MSGGNAAASPLSARLLSVTEQERDDGLRLQAHHSAWSTWAFAGDPATTRGHADAGRLLYDPQKHASHRFVYGGHDPGACARFVGAQAEWLLGYPEKALASITDSLSLAELIAHPFTLSLALTFSSVLHLNRREPERALRQLEAAEALAAEQRLSLMFEPGILRGVALAGKGADDEAIARIRGGVTNWTRLGRTRLLPYGLAFQAEALARYGDRAAALAALREGLETASATGEHFWMQNYTALPELCCSPKTSSTRARSPFSKRSASPKPNRRNRWNCAPPRASRGCGASRAGAPNRATCWHRFTAGSPRASILPICKRRRRCSISSRELLIRVARNDRSPTGSTIRWLGHEGRFRVDTGGSIAVRETAAFGAKASSEAHWGRVPPSSLIGMCRLIGF
jgi:hypothetical protein